MKFGTNVTKTVSRNLGIAAGVLAIISIPLPIVLPAAIAVGGVSAATAIASARATHDIEKTSKMNFKEICNSDRESSKALRNSLENMQERISANVQNKIEGCDVIDARRVTGAYLNINDAVGEPAKAGQGSIMRAVNVALEALAAVARVAGSVLAGVGIDIDVALMGVAIHGVVKNKSKNEQAKAIEKYIEDVEMEMELRDRQIIQIKYLLVKQHLQTAVNDIRL